MPNIPAKHTISFFLALIISTLLGSAAQADTFKLGTQESETYKQAEVLSAPEPVISSELKEECLKTSCLARFNIDARGKVSVELITSSGSAEVDEITMTTLRAWKFRPALRGSEPVASTRKIKIEFVVE